MLRGFLLSLALCVLVSANALAFDEWRYIAPGESDQNVHRAFAFAEESDDRLEFACNAKRRDLFYSAAHTVSQDELERLKQGKPTILIRVEGVGVVPLDADNVLLRGQRLIFVSAVSPALIQDLGKARQPIAAGMKADGKTFREGQFPLEGLQTTLKRLASGCGF